jgi:tetratricopeptide (TPR) repeat protein
VRPARVSSMEGESEYSFWHLLVRDVAYSQIPRAQRARRHRAAATWIERKAGERLEDLAEVLAHHYLQALELAEATGDATQAGELARPARRFLTLAGDRALGLDTVQAEARLARALELTPPDDPERPELLVRWADAAFQAGRLHDAADGLEDALAVLRDRGEAEATASALQLRSRVALRRGEGSHVALAAEAVALLEQQGPGPALMAAYAQLANAEMIAGAYAEAIVAADRACAIARELRLPEPPRALAYRGFARSYLGDIEGLAEMERALALLVEQGAGRDAAILQNNLAIARYALQGPARSLTAFEAGIAFCQERGLAEPAAQLESNCPILLAELGRPDEALGRVSTLVPILEAIGDTHSLSEPTAVALLTRAFRGERDLGHEADQLIQTARQIAAIDVRAIAFATGAAALVVQEPTRACAVLAELLEIEGARENPYYFRHLAATVRTALAAGDTELARSLWAGLESRFPLDEHALCSARAQFAEHASNHAQAAALYADAVDGWRSFGHVPELAYALLGRGRCLHALERPEAEEPLREAQKLFGAMGYGPALAETEALLQRAEARATARTP